MHGGDAAYGVVDPAHDLRPAYIPEIVAIFLLQGLRIKMAPRVGTFPKIEPSKRTQ
jgi:hypothetical protein